MAAAAGGVGLSRARTWWWLIDGSETHGRRVGEEIHGTLIQR